MRGYLVYGSMIYGIMPVSYTHLPAEDSFDSFVAIEGVQEKLSTQLSSDCLLYTSCRLRWRTYRKTLPEFLEHLASDNGAAVSYTHLDVYKRQGREHDFGGGSYLEPYSA